MTVWQSWSSVGGLQHHLEDGEKAEKSLELKEFAQVHRCLDQGGPQLVGSHMDSASVTLYSSPTVLQGIPWRGPMSRTGASMAFPTLASLFLLPLWAAGLV